MWFAQQRGAPDVVPSTGTAQTQKQQQLSEMPALHPQLLDATVELIAEFGTTTGYVEGSVLSKAIKEHHPELYPARTAKGWLKQMLGADVRVSSVQPPGKNEPCFCMAGAEDMAMQAAETRQENKRALTALALESDDPAAAKKLKANDLPTELVVEKVGERNRLVLVAAVLKLLAAQPAGGYIVGSSVSLQLQKDMPAQVIEAKNAMGGKGWLKRLLQDEPKIEQIASDVSGKNEPCYRLAQTYGVAASALQVPTASFTDLSIEAESAVIVATALAILSSNSVQYVEASVLNTMLCEQQPVPTQKVRSTLGANQWLATVLTEQQGISLITVQGLDEACFCLSSQTAALLRAGVATRKGFTAATQALRKGSNMAKGLWQPPKGKGRGKGKLATGQPPDSSWPVSLKPAMSSTTSKCSGSLERWDHGVGSLNFAGS
eukprot:gnl/TRDRNA2_/TRDRNA2_170636_c0_seq8.p1 gnl/TRDRNA2_/TRDRNA2_170636_c0~~gnl/TRDRNA2_/TRDRNA2_170636_c0_seq8.p1  ORF type:complete len:434 (+),score=89.73 gnl/TRDRNA2_/TRDRNA2_170636_c0_seq8:66-1367(+)